MPKTAQKDASVATVKKQGAVMKHIKKYWQWYAMMFIPIVYYIVFRYIPMFGNIIAFRRYRAGSSIFGDEWSGLKYFNQFMKDQNFWRACRWPRECQQKRPLPPFLRTASFVPGEPQEFPR